MLFYQLTQQFEERAFLQKTLRGGGADSPGALQMRIEQVEEELHALADRWKQSIQEAPFLQFPYEVPHLDDEMDL